jgi:arginyl-tRNA synthetase
VARLEPELPNKVVQRSDGTSVYISNDLALTPYKFSKFKIDKAIWVVGSEQNLYFKQLFKILEKLGYKWIKNCYHLSHGMVLLESGKMKSREGQVVDADDFISYMTDLAEKELKKRYKLSRKELEKRKEAIALSAIKYYFLKVEPSKDMLFKPGEAISFEGDSGPYLQYTYARASSILRKSPKVLKVGKDLRFFEINDKEFRLIKKISEFSQINEYAARQFNPSIVTNYAFKLAQLFNDFYESCPVLKAEKGKRLSRLLLVKATKQVLGNTLNLLGIKALERM